MFHEAENIPKAVLSCIKEDDPYMESKLFQIKCWCYAHWSLHESYGEKCHDFLAQVLSSEDCWKKVDDLHGVKLDRQIVGEKLIAPVSENPFSTARYRIACQCCLVEDIIALFGQRKRKLSTRGKSSLLEYDYLVKGLSDDLLTSFWSHFVSGYISKLNLDHCHPYEYGLRCAMDLKKAEAVEFFWNKIKSLPQDELSTEKDEIFMNHAVYAAGNRCNSCPEIFEFCFSQISPDEYPELLKRDSAENYYYGSLYTLQRMFCFINYQKLFDSLKPSDITEIDYYIFFKYTEKIETFSKCFVDAAVKLFMNMWNKEGFDSHRNALLDRELANNSIFGGMLLSPLLKKGCTEPVFAVLNKASATQIKNFMDCSRVVDVLSVLKKRGDEELLNKLLSYGKSVVTESSLQAIVTESSLQAIVTESSLQTIVTESSLQAIVTESNLTYVVTESTLQSMATESILKNAVSRNERRPQNFELIELLIRGGFGIDPNISIQHEGEFDKSFKERFQLYIDQIPPYLHPMEIKCFFPHFFLGSFSTLMDTEIAGKLDIEKIRFSFDGPQTLKVAVIKKVKIRNKADSIDKVRLFVISEQGARLATQRFSYGDLRMALGVSRPVRFQPVFDNKAALKVKLITINKDQQTMSVSVEDKKLYNDDASRIKFKEIEKGLWREPEDDIALIKRSKSETDIQYYVKRILGEIRQVHSNYKDSLEYGRDSKGKKEFHQAAYNGFVAGVLNNFSDRYNLRVYLEQFPGRGHADIVLLARGSDSALDSIPIFIELNAGDDLVITVNDALQQARDRAQGFQPNIMQFLNAQDNILCVWVKF